MNTRDSLLTAAVEKQRDLIFAAEKEIWTHPELGYKEWETSRYLQSRYEALGYEVHAAGNIPGFYADIDTGRPGPKLLFCGELDALRNSEHPDAVDGVVHACGHHAQSAALLGLAAALKEPGVLDGLCGSIRLMATPAEESEDPDFREELRRSGTIRFPLGKLEFMHRGYMDGCDIGCMIHTIFRDPADFSCDTQGAVGSVKKFVRIVGKSAHASIPDQAVNALSAATLAMHAVDSIKETFHDSQHVSITQIITDGGKSLSLVPGEAKLEYIIHAAGTEALADASFKISRAVTGAAAAIGAAAEIADQPGYGPMISDPLLLETMKECMETLVGKEKVKFRDYLNRGCTDMGDLSLCIPCIHPFACGATGPTHSPHFRVDPERACVNSAKAQLLLADRLLSGAAEKAHEILAGFTPHEPDMRAYLDRVEATYKKSVSFFEADGLSISVKSVEGCV